MNAAAVPVPEFDIDAANVAVEALSAEERIAWAVSVFGDQLAMLASMQKASSVLLHMFHQQQLKNEILFADTGFHFHETLQLRDEFMRRFHLNVVTLYPAATPAQQEAENGLKLYEFRDGQPECCRLRKEVPFVEHAKASGHKMIISGLKRSEGGKRGDLPVISADPRIEGYTIRPLLDWDEADLDNYIAQHELPLHALYAQSYPSIGCQVCTTPVTPGEDARAGRWRHLRDGENDGPLYCGINFSDGGGI